MKLLGVIPARGLSDRVPFKNLVDLGGRPLIEWTIQAAQESKVFDVVAVSTEDSRVAHVAKLAGATVIERPAILATPDAKTFDTVVHAFGMEPCDMLMLLQPTSPFRTAEDIINAVDMMDTRGGDSVISVTDGPDLSGKLTFQPGHADRLRPLRGWMENGGIYTITADAFRAGKDWYSGIAYGYWMPKERSLDIDTMTDLELARQMVAKRRAA